MTSDDHPLPRGWSLTAGVNWEPVSADDLRANVAVLVDAFIADNKGEESFSVEAFAAYIPYAHGWDAAYRWIYTRRKPDGRADNQQREASGPV